MTLPDDLTAGGWVLDTAPLFDIADDLIFAHSFRATAMTRGLTLLVPAWVLAAVYDVRTEPEQRVRLRSVAEEREAFLLATPLDVPGDELRRAVLRTRDAAAGLVACCGHLRNWPVLTDRPSVLRRAYTDLRTIDLSS